MNIKRIIIAVVISILPLMLGFSIVKGSFSENNDPRFSVSVLYDYVLTFPDEDVEQIRYELGVIANSGFNDAERFNPDWSGNTWEDVKEFFQMVADFFTAIWDYIIFSVKFSILVISLFIESLVWIFGFPTYLITQ